MRIELSNGGYAELRDPESVSERKRRPIIDAIAGIPPEIKGELDAIAAMQAEGTEQVDIPNPSGSALGRINDMTDLIIVALVRDWAVGQRGGEPVPVPVTLDGMLDEFPAVDYDTLRDVTAPLFGRMMPNFAEAAAVTVVDGVPVLDRGSPTPPSPA